MKNYLREDLRDFKPYDADENHGDIRWTQTRALGICQAI